MWETNKHIQRATGGIQLWSKEDQRSRDNETLFLTLSLTTQTKNLYRIHLSNHLTVYLLESQLSSLKYPPWPSIKEEQEADWVSEWVDEWKNEGASEWVRVINDADDNYHYYYYYLFIIPYSSTLCLVSLVFYLGHRQRRRQITTTTEKLVHCISLRCNGLESQESACISLLAEIFGARW